MNVTKTILAGLVAVSSLFATPMLQLDISDGTYNTQHESTVNTANQFDLIALLGSENYTGDYYISMAVTLNGRGIPNSAANLGSVVFNGQTINVTDNMIYGVPPVEEDLSAEHDGGDLQSNSTFPTFFREFAFNFESGLKAVDYDVEGDLGTLVESSEGSLYYKKFNVDVSNLAQNYSVHFDLYNEDYITNRKGEVDVDINKFAPHSHDAQASFVAANVPEPATLSLFGMGLIALSGMGLIRRRK